MIQVILFQGAPLTVAGKRVPTIAFYDLDLGDVRDRRIEAMRSGIGGITPADVVRFDRGSLVASKLRSILTENELTMARRM